MTAETDAPCRSLADYVGLLVVEIDAADPAAGAALRRIAGGRRARIGLDREQVDAHFAGGELVLEPPAGRVDGVGATDGATVLDLLAGRIEVNDAILDGRLEVDGALEDVARMFELIEVVIDASVRVPALQRLARAFAADPCRHADRAGHRHMTTLTAPAPPYPAPPEAEELALLERLDLLPNSNRETPSTVGVP